MRLLMVLAFALVGGCADCRKKPDEAIPAPPQPQAPPVLEQKPVSGQYKKVMDLRPQGVPPPFAPPGTAASADAGGDAP